MSKKKIFDNIINQFPSEEEEEDEAYIFEQKENKISKHKSTSSLTENMNNNIKDILPNIANENEEKKPKKIFKRDKFGYFVNNDENDYNSEESNSNNLEQENDSYNFSNNSEKENNESENENLSNKEEEEENNFSGDENENKILEKEENSDELKDNNNEIIENNNNSEDKYSKNDVEEDINNEYCKEDDEQNDLINELYRKSSKNENLDPIEGEEFRKISFRPKPIPGSPNFTKRISDKNLIINNNFNLNNNEVNNNIGINNNNLSNFTETIETKIEGDVTNKNAIKENEVNKNDLEHEYSHKNIISLGKLPNKDNLYPSDSIQNDNNTNANINTYITYKIEENNNIEDEEKENEEFLKREELKRKKKRENIEDKKEEKEEEIKEEKKDEDNINKDKEEPLILLIDKLQNKENNVEEDKIIENININNKEENVKEEIKDEKENNKINIINNDNDNGNYIKEESNNDDINSIKVTDISKNIVEEHKKAGESQRQSKKNNIYNNDNDSNIDSSPSIKNNNAYNNKKKEININKNNLNQNFTQKKKNSKYNSPSNKKTECNNYSSKNKNLSKSKNNKNNTNYNSEYSKKSYNKNKNNLENSKSKLYEPKKKIDFTPEKYSFSPEISKKSREICEKKDKRNKTPIGDLLYEEAKTTKKKLEEMNLKKSNDIKSNFNRKKINNKSYNMAKDRINKKIDKVIKNHSIKGKISIVGIAQSLYELNIITELIKIKDNFQDINDDLDFVELQSIIESIKGKDKKKLKELEFLEQLWFIINPSKTQYINSNILSEMLKILFSSKYNIKEMKNNIEKIFEKYNVNNNENEIKEDIKEDNEDEESYTSPLRDKTYNKQEIWPSEKFIKKFLDLIKNIKAYKDNNSKNEDIYNNIKKERDKDLTFKPDLISNSYFYKHSKYKYNNDDSNDKINSKNKKHDFNKLYQRFMEEKYLHEQTLERLRKIKNEKELKKCTHIPKINKNKPNYGDKHFKKINIDSRFLIKSNSSLDIKNPNRRYKKLISNNINNNHNHNNNNDNDSFLLDENCTFKPNLRTNKKILNKTFSNMEKTKKPRGYNEYVKRNRYVIEKKASDKKMEEDKKYGRNYDKIQKMKIKPFNITDLNESNKKSKKNIPIGVEQNNINNNEFMNNLENEKMENMIDDVYITIDIKIPNGLLKPLKIYNRNYDDTLESVNNFCKIYSINDESKKMILKKVIHFKNTFFGGNLNNDNNKEGLMMFEDLDTITNTYSNNSNH